MKIADCEAVRRRSCCKRAGGRKREARASGLPMLFAVALGCLRRATAASYAGVIVKPTMHRTCRNHPSLSYTSYCQAAGRKVQNPSLLYILQPTTAGDQLKLPIESNNQ